MLEPDLQRKNLWLSNVWLVYATLIVEIAAVSVKCCGRTGPEPPAAQGAVGASSSSFTVTLAELVVPTV